MSLPQVTPYRNSAELQQVHEWFYNDETGDSHDELISCALRQVALWQARGRVAHGIEATAMIHAAMAEDSLQPANQLALRGTYAMALIFFVNGLLDQLQTGQNAAALLQLAKTIDFPYEFVEVRHLATHGRLPTLYVLRDLSQQALEWLRANYWERQVFESGEPWDAIPTAKTLSREIVALLSQYKKQQRMGKDSSALDALVHLSLGPHNHKQLVRLLLHGKVLLKPGPAPAVVRLYLPLVSALTATLRLKLLHELLYQAAQDLGDAAESWIGILCVGLLKGPFPIGAGCHTYESSSDMKLALQNYMGLYERGSRAQKLLERQIEGQAVSSRHYAPPLLDEVLAETREGSPAGPELKRKRAESIFGTQPLWTPTPLGTVPT